MTEPIFERVRRDIEHGITSHLPHHSYHDHQQPAPPEGPAMSVETAAENVLTEAVGKLKDGVTNLEGWFDDIKPHVETIAAEAARIEATPGAQAVVKAVENAGLPDAWVDMAVDFIGKLGQLAGSSGSSTPPVAAVPAQPAAPSAT
jgi:hypothetical protein